MEKKANLKKDFVWNTIGSMFLVLISLILTIVVTRINGIKVAGYFTFGFSMANFLYIIACYGGREYQVTDETNEFSHSEYVSFKHFLYIITIFISSIIFLMFNYSLEKYLVIVLLIITKCLDAISDSYYGVLQKEQKLYLSGISLTIRNSLAIIAFLIVDYFTKSVVLSLLSWLIIYILLLIFFDIKKTNKIKKIKIKFELQIFIKIMKKCFYFFILILIVNFLYTIPRIFLEMFENDQLQAIFNILIMPATALIVGIQFFVQPLLVGMSNLYVVNKNKFKLTMFKLIGVCVILEIFALFGAYLFGICFLQIIYGIDLKNYLNILLIVILSGGFIALTSSLQAGLIIMRKTKEMFYAYLFICITSIFLSYFLIKYLGILGASLQFLLSFVLLFIVLFIMFLVMLRKEKNNER